MNQKLEQPDSTNRYLTIIVLILASVAVILSISYYLISRHTAEEASKDKYPASGNATDNGGISSMPFGKPGAANEDVGRVPSTALGRLPMQPPAGGFFIHVDKSDHTLVLYKDGKPHKSYIVTVGKGVGDKETAGDRKTPEGNFYITKIEDSSLRTYDEGYGPEKVYGPWFLRLQTGRDETFNGKVWNGIGIHGTAYPEVIGQHASQGCIRLHNDQIAELKETIYPAFIAKDKIYVVVVP